MEPFGFNLGIFCGFPACLRQQTGTHHGAFDINVSFTDDMGADGEFLSMLNPQELNYLSLVFSWCSDSLQAARTRRVLETRTAVSVRFYARVADPLHFTSIPFKISFNEFNLLLKSN